MTNKNLEIQTSHPLEEVFELEPESTFISKSVRETDIVVAETYDEKDNEIEQHIQEIYDLAISAYEDQMDNVDLVEGKFKARNSEVAVQFLNVALQAAKEKANIKGNKDKLDVKRAAHNTVNQNLIIADRNDILRSILEGETDGSSEES